MAETRWTSQHLDDFAHLRSEGWPWADIAKLYDATESALTSAWRYRNMRRDGPAQPPVSLPRPTMTEDEMLDRINAETSGRGLPRLPEAHIGSHRYGVLLGFTPIIASAVIFGKAA